MLHEGNEAQGKSGKQGWLIARRCIAIATHQGGSINLGSQIFPDFVQVQTVFFIIHDFRIVCLKLIINIVSRYRLRAICRLGLFWLNQHSNPIIGFRAASLYALVFGIDLNRIAFDGITLVAEPGVTGHN